MFCGDFWCYTIFFYSSSSKHWFFLWMLLLIILVFINISDKPAKQMILKYGQDASLACKSPSRHIQIIKVQFRDESDNGTCITPIAFCRVTQTCTGKQNCVLWADRQYISSPCKGPKPTLIVDYECEKTSGGELFVELPWSTKFRANFKFGWFLRFFSWFWS